MLIKYARCLTKIKFPAPEFSEIIQYSLGNEYKLKRHV